MLGMNDGGPAFPVQSTTHLEYPSICGQTIWDEYAKAALIGILAGAERTIYAGGGSAPDSDHDDAAKDAADYADAMIKERAKRYAKSNSQP